jgi:hypothetical protein
MKGVAKGGAATATARGRRGAAGRSFTPAGFRANSIENAARYRRRAFFATLGLAAALTLGAAAFLGAAFECI